MALDEREMCKNVYGELWQVSAFFLTYMYLLNKGRQPKEGLLGKKWRPWGLLIFQNSEAVQRDLYGLGLVSSTLLVLSIRCSLLRDFLSCISLLGGGHRSWYSWFSCWKWKEGNHKNFFVPTLKTKRETNESSVSWLLPQDTSKPQILSQLDWTRLDLHPTNSLLRLRTPILSSRRSELRTLSLALSPCLSTFSPGTTVQSAVV